jgi:hypothetical protein
MAGIVGANAYSGRRISGCLQIARTVPSLISRDAERWRSFGWKDSTKWSDHTRDKGHNSLREGDAPRRSVS